MPRWGTCDEYPQPMFLCRNKKNTNNIYYWFRGKKEKKKKKKEPHLELLTLLFFFFFFLHHQNIPCWCSVVWILMSTNKIVSAQKWTKSYLPNHPLSALTILRLMIELAGGNIWAISGDCSFRCVHPRKTLISLCMHTVWSASFLVSLWADVQTNMSLLSGFISHIFTHW